MSGPQPVRCTHWKEGAPVACNKMLAKAFAGYYQTDCPRCGKPVSAVTPGRTEIDDGDGVIIVVVTKEPRAAPTT